MAELNEYTVLINGIPHTMLLSDEDAKVRGVFKESKPKAAAPKSK